MQFAHLFLTLLKALTYIAVYVVNLYFGWLLLSSLWGIFVGEPKGYETLGRAVINFFLYNLAVGFAFMIISASISYLEGKLNRI